MKPNLELHHLLEGKNLNNGWKVIQRLDRPESATGGFFSWGYLVEHSDGRRGYLKAFDFFSRVNWDDNNWPVELEHLLREFNYEEQLLKICKNRRLSRVVAAIDSGAVIIQEVEHPSNNVRYIIFELADGDVRNQIDQTDRLDVLWVLLTLHSLTLGLNQLHSINIAHQDLKPSNALLFDGLKSAKLGDLGRATRKDVESPNDILDIAGEESYAPPELIYKNLPKTWEARRMGCDAYLLGSMIASLFTMVPMTPLILMGLDKRFLPSNWHGSYEEILPYIRLGFSKAVDYVSQEFEVAGLTGEIKDRLTEALIQLCDPDPALRGHPSDRRMQWGNQFSLQRYINLFDLLAKKAAINLTHN